MDSLTGKATGQSAVKAALTPGAVPGEKRETMETKAINKFSKWQSEIKFAKIERRYTGGTTRHTRKAANKAQRRVGRAVCREGLSK